MTTRGRGVVVVVTGARRRHRRMWRDRVGEAPWSSESSCLEGRGNGDVPSPLSVEGQEVGGEMSSSSLSLVEGQTRWVRARQGRSAPSLRVEGQRWWVRAR